MIKLLIFSFLTDDTLRNILGLAQISKAIFCFLKKFFLFFVDHFFVNSDKVVLSVVLGFVLPYLLFEKVK